MFEQSIIIVMLISIVRLSTPVVIGAMGGLFSELSGVMNLCAQGLMTLGAFFAMLGTYYTHNPWIGVLCGIAAGALGGLLNALITVEFGGNQNLFGLGLNMFAGGVTAYFMRVLFKSSISANVENLWNTSFLRGIPLVGPILSEFSPLVYIGIVLVGVVAFVIYRTPFGLRVRAVGNDPRTLETAGANVWRLRGLCVVLCGMIIGLAGAYLSLGQMSLYMDGMVAGKGMLAFIAVKMGQYTPWRITGMALLFGFFDALQMQLQMSTTIAFPTELVQTIPYVAAIIIMFLNSKVDMPKAIAKPYTKQKYNV